jgi:hypothetical protein
MTMDTTTATAAATATGIRSLRIPSEGYELDADLYLPARNAPSNNTSTSTNGSSKHPIIILAHGLGESCYPFRCKQQHFIYSTVQSCMLYMRLIELELT